jgi:serine/threonine protein phosphatase 1
LGDYVDGWSESPQVIEKLLDLSAHQLCVFIKGNHDELLQDWLLKNQEHEAEESQWFRHGGAATVKAYAGIGAATRQKHLQFLQSLRLHFLDHENRLFLHAGFTNLNGIEAEYFDKSFYWDRTLWELALALDPAMEKESHFYPKRLQQYAEIYIGHTPVTRIGETTPVHRANVWNIDTGAAFKGPLTALDIQTKAFWQSDPLPSLYPDEKGRTI